jgi:hypothetical protein
MELISKRQRILFALVFATSFSHAFVIAPVSRLSRSNNAQLAGGVTKRQFSSTTLRLSGENEATSETPVEGPFAVGSSSPHDINGGLVSLILLQAEDAFKLASQAMDDATGGFAFGYADLSPESETTPVGQAFLASNIVYAVVGILLGMQGEVVLGMLTECASIASFIYHYTQLQASKDDTLDGTVRLALLIDYVIAFSSIFVALAYLLMDQHLPPMEGIVSGGVGLACLFACWVWEKGLPYIILHSLWHFFSAYCGYVVGTSHLVA